MGYAPSPVKRIDGYFTEKEYGKVFEYMNVDEKDIFFSPLAHGGKNVRYPHKIFVGPLGETRYAFVKGSVAHVVVNETSDYLGRSKFIIEKWNIRKHRKLS